MAKGKVTKRAVDAINPAAADQFLWDEDLSGFGLKTTPADKKVYLLQYRMGGRGSSTRRMTIGTHGSPWTPASARDEAERLLALVKQGKDPAADRNERRRASVDLAFDAYVAKFLEDYGRKAWRPRTYVVAESYLRRYVTPVLKKKPIPSIRRADISAVFDALPASKFALPRNVFAQVRKLFAWAVERGDIERSPLEGFRGPATVASRDRVLSDDELQAVWLASGDIAYPFGTLFQLLIATGQRREECAGITWAELNQAQAEWVIPASRAKNRSAHTVPLNALAVALLDLRGMDGKWPKMGLIFTTNGETAVSGYSRAKTRLDKLITKRNDDEPLAPWRLHDLRRTLATGLQRLGVRFEVTEAVLNHVSGSKSGVAGVYQRHDWKQEKRDALDAWARHVEQVVAGTDKTNVVSLADRRA